VPTLVRTGDKQAPAVPPVRTLAAEDESSLIAAAKSGNARAFEILVARHQRRIFGVALRYTGVRQDAEDIMQQCFQKAFLHLHQFEGRSAFSTWLTRVAINEAQMLQRKSGGKREVSIDDLNENAETVILLEIPDSAPDPEANYSRREWRRMLSSAMNDLPRKTRRAIQLRELDERSTEETARIMGISVAAVKGRIFHGRKQLRKRLERFVGSAWSLEETPHERSVTRDVPLKVRPRAARTAEAGMKGGSYVDVSARHGVGDFGIFVFYRAGRGQRATAPPVNRLPGASISLGEQSIELSQACLQRTPPNPPPVS
jgi:RNA polymerase sigma-70 factor, ECF subfamily